jgi:Uma2 family endonuclease
MNVALRQQRMTREQFFEWAEAREERYEFDGFQPVVMTGGTLSHNQITLALHRALYARLRGSGCQPMGPDAGVATIGEAVRYPDAVITCTRTPGASRLVENPVIVFEVISPGHSATGRITKMREYLAVTSIHTYVIVEQNSIGLTVHRRHETNSWITTTLTAQDVLQLQDPALEIPVSEIYEDVDLQDLGTAAPS